jgi:uncharacterized protein (TIGR00730 family)
MLAMILATMVGVFCATDEGSPELYKEKAFELGASLAEAGCSLMTGAGNSGLMNAVVNGFAKNGDLDKLTGALPLIFKSYNVHHPKIPEQNLIWTETIHHRLQNFHDRCDVMVVLPGGFGTLHELLDFIVPRQWGMHDKPIILFNVDNYWDHQILQFQKMVEKKILKQKHLDLLTVVTNVEDCIRAIHEKDSRDHQGLNDRYWEK